MAKMPRVLDRVLRPALALLRMVLTAAALAALLLVAMTPLDMQTQLLFGASLFALALLMNRLPGKLVTQALALLSMAVSTRYLYWRITVTYNADYSLEVALGAVLLGAEMYAYLMLLLGYFQAAAPLPRKPAPLPQNLDHWPTVDVFIPTYNEPLEVVRATVLAACAMDWPREKMHVYLLDDGRRDLFRAFAAQAGVGYIIRPDNRHAKAGNLNHALGKSRSEYVAIFDCDHVPTRSFLQVCMGWFLVDKKLALVQTPHHFYSPDPFERNLDTFRTLPNEGELFYSLIQPGLDAWNAAFFCGSCAVLRRSALEEVGGIATETVTEDAHTALKLHRRGFRSAYLRIPQAGGLATESISAHVGQRIRWARGMAQIFRLDNPLLGRGLTLAQRLSYLGAMLHFFYGIPRLIFLVAPLTYALFDLHIFNALPILALAFGLPHLAHSVIANSRIQGAFRHSFWSEVYETCLAFYIAIPTTVALLTPGKGKFNVTAKGGRIDHAYFERRIAAPYLVLGALNLLGFAIGATRLWRGTGETDVLLINLVWTGYNLLILSASVAVAWEQRQVRSSPRMAVKLPAMLRVGARALRCRTIDLARGGASIAISSKRELGKGEPVVLSIFHDAEEMPLPAAVVEQHGGVLRIKFEPLDLAQESGLVRALFCRADSWISWREGERDRPLAALGSIATRGLRNFGHLLGSRRPPTGKGTGAAEALPPKTTPPGMVAP